MYESGYNKLFWGMMFIIFNINIQSINLLPNFIGYMLVLWGLGSLSSQHRIFEKGKLPSAILIILTLGDIVNLSNVNIQNGQLEMRDVFFLALGAVTVIINLYLLFILCKGIHLAASERGLDELSSSARSHFNFNLAVSVILLFYIPFSINLPRDFSMFMILCAAANLIALLFIAGLFREAKYQLGDETESGFNE